jgi:hypothetical protein
VTWYLNVLKSNDSPLAEKQLALDYVVHLVGDLHLPLHVGLLDDLGGTKTKVTFQGKEQTLHELWDAGMLETENETPQAMAKLLDEECDPHDRTVWQAGTPADTIPLRAVAFPVIGRGASWHVHVMQRVRLRQRFSGLVRPHRGLCECFVFGEYGFDLIFSVVIKGIFVLE